MEKITRVFMTGMQCLLVSGCNNSGNSTAAKEQQETLFNELNRAAEKCVERGNLQIDWQYAGQQDLKCDGKELEEINVGPSRNITLYDFKHQRSISYFYALEDADPQAEDKIGMACSYINGYYVELSFAEVQGKRTFQKAENRRNKRREAFPYTENDFAMIVRDVDKDYFHIEKEENDKEIVYTLTMSDKDQTNQRYKQDAQERGEDAMRIDNCTLDTNEIIDQKLVYHVNTDGYLSLVEASTTWQINDVKKEVKYTASYETFDTFDSSVFEEAITY